MNLRGTVTMIAKEMKRTRKVQNETGETKLRDVRTIRTGAWAATRRRSLSGSMSPTTRSKLIRWTNFNDGKRK